MINSIEPSLIAETASWLVFNKPAGWLSIPPSQQALPNPAPVLSSWIEKTYGRVWTVHRLDRETSGVILFARTADAHREANTWFQKHETKKTYHCLAEGIPSLPVFKIQTPIEGAPSTTQIEVKEKYTEGFYAWVRPLTGKRHQIRIHFSGAGHPLWGDPTYGGEKEIESISLSVARVALHAAALELPSGEKFSAPLPSDFQSWLDTLRAKGTRRA